MADRKQATDEPSSDAKPPAKPCPGWSPKASLGMGIISSVTVKSLGPSGLVSPLGVLGSNWD